MLIPSDRPRFPSPDDAGPEGLLMLGGSLHPDWLIEAYTHGIFPMPLQVDRRQRVLGWFSPNPRGILEFDDLYVSSRLARRLRRGEFQFTIDQAFPDVLKGCAAARDGKTECWLTQSMQNAYRAMHKLGLAHSVEVWKDGELAGGVFGMSFGGFFAGESMFHYATDASKAALVHLVERMRQRGFQLLDVQWTNAHTLSLGASDIPRETYLGRLAAALKVPTNFV
jgi:leucyl/phenylalanyl-tRNA--protein transferase